MNRYQNKTKSFSFKDSDADRRHNIFTKESMTLSLISSFSGDQTLTKSQLMKLRYLHKTRGQSIYSDIIYTITHQYFPSNISKFLWGNILSHKFNLSKTLGRNIKIVVAALDYLSNITDNILSTTLISESYFEKIIGLSLLDGLTGLYNQTFFFQQIDLEIRRFLRYKEPVSLIMIDIDDFKQVNDTLGHLEGDEVLVKLASLLKRETRDTDICCRYGGEEFVVILTLTKIHESIVIAKRLQKELEIFISNQKTITVSIGVATYDKKVGTYKNLIKNADDALYYAKQNGKNQIHSHQLLT